MNHIKTSSIDVSAPLTPINGFYQDTDVYTLDGIKKIKDVEIDNYILTKNGHIKKVVKINKNELHEHLYHLVCYKTSSIHTTSNQKFLSITKEQLSSNSDLQENLTSSLSIGDYIAIPNQKEFYSDNSVLALDFYDRTANDILTRDRIFVTPDFMYFLGVVIGNGYIKEDNLIFEFDETEIQLKEFVLNYFQSEFGLDQDQLIDNNHFDITCIKIKSQSLVDVIYKLIYNSDKFIIELNKELYKLGNTYIFSLLQGLLDSYGEINNDDYSLCLFDNNLTKEFYHLLRNRNVLVEIKNHCLYDGTLLNSDKLVFEPNSSFVKQCSRFVVNEENSNDNLNSIEYNGYTLVQILEKEISDFDPEYVYNIEVEDDNSIVVEGLITIN